MTWRFLSAGCGLYAQSAPAFAAQPWVLLLPGAGGHAHSPFLLALAHALAQKGAWVGRVNFPHSEQGRRLPGRFEGVVKALRQLVVDFCAAHPPPCPLVLAGKSMGGRAAAAADWTGLPVARLVALGYPLHPAGKPEKLRDQPLLNQPLPLTLVQGERDALCDLALLGPVLSQRVVPFVLHLVEGVGHDLVPRGQKEADWATLAGWILESGNWA